MNKTFFLFFVFIFSSCQENLVPKDVLNRYIELRLNGSTNKEEYYEVVDGDLKQFIDSLDDEEFKAFLASTEGVKKRNLNVLHSTCRENQCHFTYVISLVHNEGDKALYHADVKKVALIEKLQDSWKLTDIVSEPKTFLKGIDPITPDDFSRKYGIDPDTVKIDRGGRALIDREGNFQTKKIK